MDDEIRSWFDVYMSGFGAAYLGVALTLGSKVSSAMLDLLEQTHYYGVIGDERRVVEKRPYKPAAERTKEDKSRDLPKRLTQAQNKKVQKFLPIAKVAKRRLLFSLLGVFVIHLIVTLIFFPDNQYMWLLPPGHFAVFYVACLIARSGNRLRVLARMEGWSPGRF